MMFGAPWLLAALAGLPALWWLLRASPPAPRRQVFPAIALLAGLAAEQTPAVTPWWLLVLRLAAAGLVIVGLAGPALVARGRLPGSGRLLLVVDDGWSAAADWPARVQAAGAVLDRAARAGRPVSLLTTAPGLDGSAPRLGAPGAARSALAALVAKPWPPDRAAAARALAGVSAGGAVYVSDGVAEAGDPAFAAALRRLGAVEERRGNTPAATLMAVPEADGLRAVLHVVPGPAWQGQVLAETAGGQALAKVPVAVADGANTASVLVSLPSELRNQLASLRLDRPGAGGVALLDESARRRPVGLVRTGGAQTPLMGPLFYLDRALAPSSELRRGDIAALLSRPLSVLVVSDRRLAGAEAAAVEAWVRQGGMLVRFAGPNLAGDGMEASAGDGMDASVADALLPVSLLAGDRQLGGAMSWGTPQRLAAFPPGPFEGLTVPAEVSVARQVLADPGSLAGARVWARLADGTPLVSAAALGRGEIVLFHVTSNADWSNLPLSGLFVDMLQRLVRRTAGVAAAGSARQLAPSRTLDGLGVLGPPNPAARPIAAAAIAAAVVSPAHPPGFYGLDRDLHALDLGAGLTPRPLAPIGRVAGLAEGGRDRPFGPALIALGFALLCADLLATAWLRGWRWGFKRPAIAAMLLLSGMASAHAQSPALAMHLAYVVTGDAATDATSRAGLQGLADYINLRTSATLAEPVPVVPGRDDLSFFPLLYWPIVAAAPAPNAAATAALNDFMAHGGVVLIDTAGDEEGQAGSGAGLAPGVRAVLRRDTAGLDVPSLVALTTGHVLAHSFYLLPDFPGRYDGGTVWVSADQDRSRDSVSPVVIGDAGWAAAWATDGSGAPLYATIPGGAWQRTLAFRFGVNLVMYALTGNYKGDQVHVPALLQRLGE